jgi:hypothetical protein
MKAYNAGLLANLEATIGRLCGRRARGTVSVAGARAAQKLPPFGLRLSLKAPHVIRVGHPVVFYVGLSRTTKGIDPNWAGADEDFGLGGGWKRPQIRTPDGSQACGGDNVPQQPQREANSAFWHLDFGDCSGIDLVLIATRPGAHSLVIRPFAAPLVGGEVVKSRRVLER